MTLLKLVTEPMRHVHQPHPTIRFLTDILHLVQYAEFRGKIVDTAEGTLHTPGDERVNVLCYLLADRLGRELYGVQMQIPPTSYDPPTSYEVGTQVSVTYPRFDIIHPDEITTRINIPKNQYWRDIT